MNIIQHSHISARKFGGRFEDYLEIHRFLDSTKLYFHHVKHRAVLHNTFGVEFAVELFGDCVVNSDGKATSVRDVAIAHVREDLSGKVPTLVDWFGGASELESIAPEVPSFLNEPLKEFVMRPFLRSGLKGTMFITMSDFGVELCEKVLGVDAASELRENLPARNLLQEALRQFRFRERWQYTPCQKELQWLAENGLS